MGTISRDLLTYAWEWLKAPMRAAPKQPALLPVPAKPEPRKSRDLPIGDFTGPERGDVGSVESGNLEDRFWAKLRRVKS